MVNERWYYFSVNLILKPGSLEDCLLGYWVGGNRSLVIESKQRWQWVAVERGLWNSKAANAGDRT
jgi:hypothetical protein